MNELEKTRGKLESCILIYENYIDCTIPFEEIKSLHLSVLYTKISEILLSRINEKEKEKC